MRMFMYILLRSVHPVSAGGVHPDVRRAVPGLQHPRLRHPALADRPRGRHGQRVGHQPGRRLLHRVRRRRHRRGPAAVRRRPARHGDRHPLQRRRARRAARGLRVAGRTVRGPGRPRADADGRAQHVLAAGDALCDVHGAVPRRVRGGADLLRRRRRRPDAEPVQSGRGAGGALRRRGVRAVPAPGAAGRRGRGEGVDRPARGYSSPVRNCARPWPKLQSSSVFSTTVTMTSSGRMPQRRSSCSQTSR